MAIAHGGTTLNPVIDRVSALATPIVTDLGLEIYDIEHTGGVLRIVVDSPQDKQSGVTMESIALITRLISRELDHSDPVPGRYTLEVSSPGLERLLRSPRHFVREIGSTVAVRLTAAVDGVRRIQGLLVAANENNIVVQLDDQAKSAMSINYTMIDRARTVFEWGPTPKSSTSKTKKNATTMTPAEDFEQ